MKRRVRLTESDLHRIVKESVNRILNESYRGVYIYGAPFPGIEDKIDACFDKGWSVEKIQRAIDSWRHNEMVDYGYKW